MIWEGMEGSSKKIMVTEKRIQAFSFKFIVLLNVGNGKS